MAETRCPFCGFSPIPRESDACPRCRRRFVDDAPDVSTVTATRAGGITGAVTASPLPAAVALVAGAVVWLFRLVDVFTPSHDPAWVFAVPALLVAGAGSVMAAVGPAKHVSAALGLVSSAIAAVWPAHLGLHDGALIGYGLVLIGATVSEPSSLRLKGGTAAAVGVALVALVGLAVPMAARGASESMSLSDDAVGLRWGLPAGWRELEHLSGGLAAPKRTSRRSVLFAGDDEGAQAALVFDRLPGEVTCEGLLASLGASARKAGDEAPAPFPRGTPMLEVPAATGTLRAACAITSSDALLALVVSTSAAPKVAESSLRVLASGVVILADPNGP